MRTTYYVAGLPFSSELYHHGIIGQKWGVRRYQNPDGSLTPEGRLRYSSNTSADRARSTIMEGARRYYKSHPQDSYTNKSLEAKLRSEIGDDLKVLKSTRDISLRESKEVEKEEIFRKRPTRQNLEDLDQAVKLDLDIDANITLDYIRKIPKEKRDLAMAYAYGLLFDHASVYGLEKVDELFPEDRDPYRK